MQAKDVRAVENPITAIFDLAEDVERRAPTVQRLLRYTRVFLYAWLFLDALLVVIVSSLNAIALLLLLLLYGLLLIRASVRDLTAQGLLLASAIIVAILLMLTFRGPALILGVVLVSLFYLGMVILDLIQDVRSFFNYYALRYRVIRAVREADPVVLVPQGATPVDRLLTLLGQRSEIVAGILANREHVRVPAILTGRTGVAYQFDAFLTWPAGTLAPFGVGDRGTAVYVKAFDHAPTRADLEALRRAVQDVTGAVRLPPGRVIALWKTDGSAEIPEETYAFLTTEVVPVVLPGGAHACSIELVTEMTDGTYDFIPLIVDLAPAAAWRANPSSA
ncbi:MAG TPA: hypothetical protein VGR51_02335 [Thermoplasmata archaeon]|nr:hypothetical protein [Thermoplasmata archaeon]